MLFVSDDERTRNLLRWHFEQDGFGVEIANGVTNGDATQRLQAALEHAHDLLIVDGGLDNGFAEAFRALRRRVVTPIIFIAEQVDTLEALWDAGIDADDYVVRPIRPREVLLRAKSVLRRAGRNGHPSSVLLFPGLRLDRRKLEVYVQGKRIPLTRTEFGLLWHLACEPGTVFRRPQLLREVWGYEALSPTDERTVDAYVKRLRRRFLSLPGIDCRISTVWGSGYKFELGAAPAKRTRRRRAARKS